MTDIILIAVILVIVGCAALYIYREKKSGAACIGCPHGKACSGKSCGCGCSKDADAKP